MGHAESWPLCYSQGPAYASVFGDSEQVDDEEMEFERMRELLFEVTQVLATAKAELTGMQRLSALPASPSVNSNSQGRSLACLNICLTEITLRQRTGDKTRTR